MQPAGDPPLPNPSGAAPKPPAVPPAAPPPPPPAAPPPPPPPVVPPSPEPLEKWLWVDPFAENVELRQRMDSGAVLLAEDIMRYVSYNLLINKMDFDAGVVVGAKLKGASYTMTPDPDEGWMVNEDNKLVKLKVEVDPTGQHFVVPKHSLVFIRLKQRLRVPYYMIGRHNLKITYVYQGLLLGTGPQVDPGFVGQLYIPLHNFTTSNVNVYLNDSFVSIDFARTSPLSFDKGVPETLDELYKTYGDTKWLYDRKKLFGRSRLTDYLNGKTPQSAMVALLHEYRETLKQWQKIKDDTQNLNANIGTQIDEFKKDLGRMQQQQEARVNAIDARVDASHAWNRIEAVVVAGIIVTATVAMIAFVHQCNDETRSVVSESLNNKMLLIQNDLSNSLSSLSKTQQLIVKDQAELNQRLKTVETNDFSGSNTSVGRIATNAVPAQRP